MGQGGHGPLPVFAARPAAEADTVVAAHQHHVQHVQRETVLDPVALRHVAEAQAGLAGDAARLRPERAQQRAQHRGLARAVGPDQTEEVALRDAEAQVAQDGAAAVAESDVTEADQVVHDRAAASCCRS